MSLVQSWLWIFWFSWLTCAAACIPAIWRSSRGAHVVHSPRCPFQHTCSHTHWPQRWHWWKKGFISSTARASALSRVDPPDPGAHPLGVPADLLGPLAHGPADQVAAQPEEPAAEPGDRVLERRAVTVAAATAVELELIPVVGAAVLARSRDR